MGIIEAIELLNKSAKTIESRYGKAAGGIVINDAIVKGIAAIVDELENGTHDLPCQSCDDIGTPMGCGECGVAS